MSVVLRQRVATELLAQDARWFCVTCHPAACGRTGHTRTTFGEYYSRGSRPVPEPSGPACPRTCVRVF